MAPPPTPPLFTPPLLAQQQLPTPNQAIELDLAIKLESELTCRHSFVVNEEWLLRFLSGTVKKSTDVTQQQQRQQQRPPLAVLTSTAQFRLLNSDITQSLLSKKAPAVSEWTVFQRPTTLGAESRMRSNEKRERQPRVLPPNITDVNTQSTILQTDVPVQVLRIADVGSSKWTQIEAIERWEKGEEVRGREVIRSVPGLDESSSTTTSTGGTTGVGDGTGNGISSSTTTSTTTAPARQPSSTNGPHKLLLQDASGTQIQGFELSKMSKIFITNTAEQGGLNIGCKIVLKSGCLVRRGVVMLTPDHAVVLGGKVDSWDVEWRKSRKARLMAELRGLQDDITPSTINNTSGDGTSSAIAVTSTGGGTGATGPGPGPGINTTSHDVIMLDDDDEEDEE